MFYLSIEDATKRLNKKVNLMGIIQEYGPYQRSRGTDWYRAIKIKDETCPRLGISDITVTVFSGTEHTVPHIESHGDIACFMNVTITKYLGKFSVRYEKGSKFALLKGREDNIVVYQVVAQDKVQVPPRLSNVEKDFSCSMKKFLLDYQLKTAPSELILPLAQIEEGKRFDLVCQVLKVYEVSNGKWMLLLWDGTDVPPLCCRERLQDESEDLASWMRNPSFLSRDVLSEFPHVGTVLGLSIDLANKKLAPQYLSRWVKVINVTCENRNGLWCGVWGNDTRVWILSNSDIVVQEQLRFYSDRLIQCLSTHLQPSNITDIFNYYKNESFTTLADVLTYPQAMTKFRCIVRFSSMCPSRVEDFRSPDDKIYRIMLRLEDPTATLHAILFGKDGEEFFKECYSVNGMTRKLNKLFGVEGENAPRNPPWVQVCLLSYPIDVNDLLASRRYRIINTRLVD